VVCSTISLYGQKHTITHKYLFLYDFRVSAADFDYLKVIGTGSFGKV